MVGFRRAFRVFLLAVPLFAGMGLAGMGEAASAQPAAGTDSGAVLPRPTAPFAGRIGRFDSESTPDRFKRREAPAGAPNVLLIMTDDVGFGASSTFGGPIPTPTLDALAAQGLRYNTFHTTALCSPTRAALLTGRNNNRVGVGYTVEAPSFFPGNTSVMPDSAGTIAEVLRQNGYSTAMLGKWHLTPAWEIGPAGPFDRWPTGRGFEHFYGFLPAETDQFAPALYDGVRPVDPPRDPDYILDRDLADRAIAWLRQQKYFAGGRPFFLYLAPGTAHVPNHAPADWIARFKGRFDNGWDAQREEIFVRQKRLGIVPANARLTSSPPQVARWNGLTSDQRRLYARMMEVHAASLAYADDQIGRILASLREMGELDNTLVIFIQGDNGPSDAGAENGMFNSVVAYNRLPRPDVAAMLSQIDQLGGPLSNGEYPVGWAHAMATPFQWWKGTPSHLGGTRNGMVVSWPARIKRQGGVRQQFHHVIDIAPTIYEAVGVAAPSTLNGVAQDPLDGVSMVYSFNSEKAPSHRRTQYFTIGMHAGLYEDGWMLSTTPKQPGTFRATIAEPSTDLTWELYDLTRDFSQSVNLAPQMPERVEAMQARFWSEAERNRALPLHDPPTLLRRNGTLTALGGQTTVTLYPGTRVPAAAAPRLTGRSFTIVADFEVAKPDAQGMLLQLGNRHGGTGLYLLQGRPTYSYTLGDGKLVRVAAPDPLPPGRHIVSLDFAFEGAAGSPATVRLMVNGQPAATGHLARTMPTQFGLDAMLSVGTASPSPVSPDFEAPFVFDGPLKLTVTVR